jgi:hypothetical protein
VDQTRGLTRERGQPCPRDYGFLGVRPDISQFGEAATKVAQVSNLLYRGFPIRWRLDPRTVCRLEVGDTADWKSALLAPVALGKIVPQMHEMDR